MSSPTLNPLERLLRLDGSSPEFHDQISNILYGKEYAEWARHIEGDDVTELVDCLDRLLDALDPTGSSFRKCLRELRNICGQKLRLPTSYSLHSQVLHVGHLPVASGGFGDIYEGKLNGARICVKRLRVYARSGPQQPTKNLYQEAVMWKRAEHKNIVPLLGITVKPLQLVSEWMPHENLTEYIGNNPDISRLGLLSDIAEGLHYLHSCNIVHGDLKGPNILLDKQGCARITDFGLTTVTQNLDSIRSVSDDHGHTGRWAAPEILNGGEFSKEADVFSFAMVMIEAFTGAVPFNGKVPATAMLLIMSGERPPRPSHPQFTSHLWALMQRCWDKNPVSRPEVSVILTNLNGTQVGQAPARTDDTGIPHADLRSTPSRGNTPKKNLNGKSPRLDPNHGLDDDTEGKYWSRGKGTRVASRIPGTTPKHNQSRGSSQTTPRNSVSHTDDGPPVLEQLRQLDRCSSRFHDQLNAILRSEEYERTVSNFKGDDLVWLINYLDKSLDSPHSSGPSSLECLCELRRICGARIILPASCALPSPLLDIDKKPVDSGGPGDVYRGTLNGLKVCVKRVRMYSKDGPEKVTQIYRGVVVWKHMEHKNILPLLGLTPAPLQLISEWMPGGDLEEYIDKHPDANRLGLLRDITEGLHFLHSCDIIHSDLKGSNILVGDTGNARITDLSLAMMTTDDESARSPSRGWGRTTRWTAPEILNEEGTYSKQSDIFSFAMVMVEVFTCAIPFRNSQHISAMLKIMNEERPPRPKHKSLTDELWTLMQRCWDHDPHSRPETLEVLEVLNDPKPSPQNRLHQLDRIIADKRDKLLRDEGYVGELLGLESDELIQLVDYLSNILDRLARTGGSSGRCLYVLHKICGTRKVLPSTYEVSRMLAPLAGAPIIRGGFCDTQRGSLSHSTDVCIKRLRVFNSGDEGELTERFCKEAIVWKHLNHPNIVPFKGVTLDPPQLISEWMPGGELREYVRGNPSANLIVLLLDVAQGLAYLHSCDVVHGNLKGTNVVVDAFGNARITDFGLANTIHDRDSAGTSSGFPGHTLRWTAPEVLRNGTLASKKSDMFSYAMVVFEAFSGTIPFSEIPSQEVPEIIMNGDRPSRPAHSSLTDSLWELTQSCWDDTAENRPEIEYVAEELKEINFISLSQELSREPRTVAYDPSSIINADRQSVSLLFPGPNVTDRKGVASVSNRPDQSFQDPGQVTGGPVLPLRFPAIFSTTIELAAPGMDQQKKHGIWCRLKRPRNPDRSTSNPEQVPEEAGFTPQQQTPTGTTGEGATNVPQWRKRWLRCGRRQEPRPWGSGQPILPANDTTADVSALPADRDVGRPTETGGGVSISRLDSQPECQSPDRPGQGSAGTRSGGRGSPPGNYGDGVSHPQMDGDHADEQKGEGGDTPAWRQLANPELTIDERISLVRTTLSDGDIPGEAQAFIDAVYGAFCDLPQECFPREIHRQLARYLYKICGRKLLLPGSMRIPLCYDRSELPCYNGGFADVWKGTHDGQMVAAKALRVYQKSDFARIRKRFCREVITWKILCHPNVLPLIGVTMDDDRFVMVSEWMENGNIVEFLRTKSNANRLGLLVDAAKGLIYMHDRGVVHGDLKGENILINRSGHACLADFSLITVVTGKSGFITSPPEGGTTQWMSPELLHPEEFGFKNAHPTRESDCYALGMVIYEILSGKTPFSPCGALLVMSKVLGGERPEIPEGDGGSLFTDIIKEMLHHCWKEKPSERMAAGNILRGLEGDPSVFTAFSTQSADAAIANDDPRNFTTDDSSDNESECAESPDHILPEESIG